MRKISRPRRERQQQNQASPPSSSRPRTCTSTFCTYTCTYLHLARYIGQCASLHMCRRPIYIQPDGVLLPHGAHQGRQPIQVRVRHGRCNRVILTKVVTSCPQKDFLRPLQKTVTNACKIRRRKDKLLKSQEKRLNICYSLENGSNLKPKAGVG